MDIQTKEFTAASFYEFLGAQKLMGTRCTCGNELYLPPRSYCPACEKGSMQWQEFSGKGKLLSYTIIYIGPAAMIAAGFDRKKPYCVGIVQLEEGPRISAMITNVDLLHPESIKIGAPLAVEFLSLGSNGAQKPVLAFRMLE
jgi:uncharacterized protein